MIGFCGVLRVSGSDALIISFAVDRSFWGKGVATRTVEHALNHAANVCIGRQVHGVVCKWNFASARILAKCGFVQQPGGYWLYTIEG
jgi:RimJ/RimL family protein N-acetyltransferase